MSPALLAAAEHTWQLPRTARSVSLLRRQVRESCTSLAEVLVDDLQIMASELMTNALEHGQGEVTARLCRDAEVVRLEVSDEAGALPSVADADPDAEAGRGLAIVAALASRWGVDADPGGAGKTVWCELDLAPAS